MKTATIQKDISDILKAFRTYQTFLISTHVHPDPDALASELSLAVFLRSLKKKVFIINEAAVPERYLFLPGASAIRKMIPRHRVPHDVAVIVDCGELSRIGNVEKILEHGTRIINIDHHLTNRYFGRWNLVDPKASSTCEVIFDLFRRARFPLNDRIALLLYLGILTDTGSFRYENTTPHTHRVAAELMRFRLSVTALYKRLYETIPLADMKNFHAIVSHIRPLSHGRVICIELRKTTMKKFSEAFDLRDKIFQHLRAIKDVEVIVILTEDGRDRTRINMRSHGKLDVAKVACGFDGGGHRRASGCVIARPLSKARQVILRAIQREL